MVIIAVVVFAGKRGEEGFYPRCLKVNILKYFHGVRFLR